MLVVKLRTGSPQGKGLKGPASHTGDGAPERLVIPAIGVDSGFMPLGLVGHVSSRSGAAVFYRLAALTRGDVVEVLRHKGTVAKFAVDSVLEYPKDAFPTDRVYGNVSGSALRLITCGGTFNSSTGHYDDNIVVFAHLVN